MDLGQLNINKAKSNMASVAEICATYHGKNGKDIELWLKKAEMAFTVYLIDKRERLRLVLGALRDRALEWVILLGEEVLSIEYENFKQ